jgi:16S rRNA (guanine527-N7)-methyltransferase
MERDSAELIGKIATEQSAFGLSLSDGQIARLADYYELIIEYNPLLHLVGPCSPAEFATRHILESLTLLEFLPAGAKFADVGSGGGLPAIPCLIVREDLSALLIESKEKKARFLQLACDSLQLNSRAGVENKQFAEVDIAGCSAVSCRALEKFAERLPRLVKWAEKRPLLLFAGEDLPDTLAKAGRRIRASCRMPLSERRYLFVAE